MRGRGAGAHLRTGPVAGVVGATVGADTPLPTVQTSASS
jgi:hypothetical protein